MSDGDVIITEDISEVEKDNEILNASSLRVNKRLSVSKKRLITVPDVSDKEVVSKEILEAGEEDNQVIRTDFTSLFSSGPRPMDESNTMSTVKGMKDKDDRMTSLILTPSLGMKYLQSILKIGAGSLRI